MRRGLRRRPHHAEAAVERKRLPAAAGHHPTVSVVVPALNEAKNLPHVLTDMPSVAEIILVDGGSTDGMVDVARRLCPGIRIVQQTRRGKGNALACGFAAAIGDIIVMIDADGSTDPGEIPRFVAALRAGADFAKGTRFAPGAGSSDITRLRRYGNRCLNQLVNMMFGTAFTDLCYGYNAFWADCLPIFRLDATSSAPADGRKLWGDGFEIETMLNLRAARARLRVTEVASFEHRRIHGASNLNAATDGLRVLRTIAHEWPARRHMLARHELPDEVRMPSQSDPRRVVAAAENAATVGSAAVGQ